MGLRLTKIGVVDSDDETMTVELDHRLRVWASRKGNPALCRKVVIMRFGFFGVTPLTLREIGEEIGRSPERVRQIESSFLRFYRMSKLKGSEVYYNHVGPVKFDKNIRSYVPLVN